MTPKIKNKNPNPKITGRPERKPDNLKPENAGKHEPINFFEPLDFGDPHTTLTDDEVNELCKALAKFKTKPGHKRYFDEKPVIDFLLQASRQLKSGLALVESCRSKDKQPGPFKKTRAQLDRTIKEARSLTEMIEQLMEEPFYFLLSGKHSREQLGLEGKSPDALHAILLRFVQDLETTTAHIKRRPGRERKAHFFISHLKKLGSLFRHIKKEEPTSHVNTTWIGFAMDLTNPIAYLGEKSASKYTAAILHPAEGPKGFPILTEQSGRLVYHDPLYCAYAPKVTPAPNTAKPPIRRGRNRWRGRLMLFIRKQRNSWRGRLLRYVRGRNRCYPQRYSAVVEAKICSRI